MEKVSKGIARAVFLQGGTIFFAPCKMPKALASCISLRRKGKNDTKIFNAVIRLHSMHTCNKKDGLYLNFYIAK